MEARNYVEQTEVDYQQIDDSPHVQPLRQEQKYREFIPSTEKQFKRQQQEISFFCHLAVYSLLVTLILLLSMSVFPFIIAAPTGLLVPLGIILGCKRLWKMFIKK